MSAIEEAVVAAAEAAVNAAVEATASSGDAFGERLEAMAAKLSAAARAGVKGARRGQGSADLRFLFNGQRVRDDEAPQDLDMEDGDQIDCILEQQGDIGTGDHAGSHGLAFLQPGAKLDDAPAAVVREIAARCRRRGSEGDAPCRVLPGGGPALRGAAQRPARGLDLGARGARDFKKRLTRREASSGLGEGLRALEALFRSPRAAPRRRDRAPVAAVGQCINFHTDVNHKTFQLCLNDNFDGGDLVFAADDKLAAK
ncbi:hypothetical protein SO694_000283109 [Aureococcus anophagefferens]|uniref:Ubiquitin-like domain-containing protein n=1 Tax=Aureococcus anophagefferens TaxID=44056 RepID=A0ABR1FVU3_AURAN